MVEGLTSEYDALVCVGYHSRAGAHGVLSHSFMGHEIEDMWLDGRATGEIGLVHATAAALGVPLAALTGDDAACAEATAWDAGIATAPVKYVRSRFAAELRPENEARKAIEDTVASALVRRETRWERSDAPATLAVRWQSSAVAETLLGIPGVTAVDPRTVQAVGTPPDLFRQFGVWMRVASALTNQPPYC
jgi:D-amino peptidase